jgi:hypothetical protein
MKNCTISMVGKDGRPLARFDRAFEHPDWIFEPKMDGFRAVAYVEGGALQRTARGPGSPHLFPRLLFMSKPAPPLTQQALRRMFTDRVLDLGRNRLRDKAPPSARKPSTHGGNLNIAQQPLNILISVCPALSSCISSATHGRLISPSV